MRILGIGPSAGGAKRAPVLSDGPCHNCGVVQAKPALATALGPLGHELRVPAGQVLWKQGDRHDHVALICRGVVLATVQVGGEPRAVGIEVTGAFLGADSSLWTGIRPSEALSLTPTALLVVPAAAFRELVTQGGPTALAIGEILSRNCSGCNRLFSVGYGAVPERVARVLLHLLRTHATQDERGVFVPVPLSRTQLADLVGCRVETLIRALKSPPIADIVTFQREGFAVTDPAELERLTARATG